MVTTVETSHKAAKSWNFGTRENHCSLDDFLARKAESFKFFEGSEPWIGDHDRVTWENFFRFCTEEMDDLSQRALKLVIEYCLEILEEAEAKIDGKPSLGALRRRSISTIQSNSKIRRTSTTGRYAIPW